MAEVLELKYLYLAIALALMVVAASAGTFTPGLEADTYVDKENANSTFADAGTLWATSSDGEPSQVAYLVFINNFGTPGAGITSDSQIESATFKINVSEVANSGKVTIYLIHGGFTSEINWEDSQDLEVLNDVTLDIPIEEPGVLTVDATDLTKEAVRVCLTCPFGFKIVADGDASIGFASMESDGFETELEYKAAE